MVSKFLYRNESGYTQILQDISYPYYLQKKLEHFYITLQKNNPEFVKKDKDPIEIKTLFLEEFGNLKGASFNPIRATVKTFFDYCIQNKIYLDSNPIDLVKRKKEAKKLVDPFTDDEIEKILNSCPPEHRYMYETFLNTGVRLDELSNLKFKDFDSERQVLHVRGHSRGGGAKGDKGRDIPSPSLLMKKYETYLSDYRLKKPSTSEYVFINPRGGKLVNASINTRMRTLSKNLKFRIHPHKFRATYATHLHRENVSVVIISLLLGHESIETTMRYISVSESEKRQAQQKATYLGKLSEETKRLERINREKQDLMAQISELIRQNELLLEKVRKLRM